MVRPELNLMVQRMFLITLLAACSARAQDPPPSPALVPDREMLEFSLYAGEAATRRIKLSSPAEEPVIIERVEANHAALRVFQLQGDSEEPIELGAAIDLRVRRNRGLRLSVVVDGALLEVGDHRHEIRLFPRDAAEVILPVRIWIRDKNAAADKEAAAPVEQRAPEVNGLEPRIQFDEYNYDFGDRLEGERLRYTFHFRNDGEGDLVIENFKVQCHCSIGHLKLNGEVARLALRRQGFIGILKPGEAGELEIEIDSLGLGGRIRKQFFLYTNDVRRGSPVTLNVIATLNLPFQFDPPSVVFGEVRRSRTRSQEIVMTSRELEDFEIVGMNLPPNSPLSVSYRPHDTAANTWVLRFTLLPTAGFGEHVGTVGLAIDHELVKECRITYQAKVLPEIDFLVDGTRMDIDSKVGGNVNFAFVRAPDINTSRTIVVENRDPSTPYIPTAVHFEATPSAEPFSAEIIEIERGVRYEILLKVDPHQENIRYFSGQAQIESDHPSLPHARIHFSGYFNTRAVENPR